MARRSHETLTFQHNAGIGEEVFDFRTGDRVMTVDGFPGKVVARNSGPWPGTEDYEVVLDSGMGGGAYTAAQLKRINANTAALHEAAEVTASIPVEAITSHTADIDYPELGTILYDRQPNENVKLAANKDDEASKPQSSQEDPGEREDQEDTPNEETDDTDENTDTQAAEEPADEAGKGEEDAGPPDIEQEKVNNTPEVTPPSACSFCGADAFEDSQMTGRGVRMRCSQCGGTMKSWGGQWEPEFPNSSQNNASGQSDWSQGGAAGVANAPGANFKTSKLDVEAGIVNWVVDKIYDRIEERKNHEILGRDWAWQTGLEGLPNHDTNYADYHCALCDRVHPQTLHPDHLTVHGSLTDEYDAEWSFHFTASWRDVQSKAKRIRKEGGVKILVANSLGVAGEVKGDHNVYESQLNYVLGTKHVADWSCGCKWASYTWGRSPSYRRYEGRLCSHALALQYEASARGMFGKDVAADTERPDWQRAHHPVQVQHQRGTERAPEKDIRRRAVPPGNMRRTFSSLDTDGVYESPELLDLRHAPIFASVQEMFSHGEDTPSIIEMMASFSVSREAAKDMLFEAFHVDENGIRRDGDEYATPDGDRFNHGDPTDQDQWYDPEHARANQRDLSDHDDDDWRHKHHRTNDAREHAPHWGWGLPAGVPIESCGQCNGSGCGHCAGQGQVVSDANSASASGTPDQTADAGDVVSGISTNGAARRDLCRHCGQKIVHVPEELPLKERTTWAAAPEEGTEIPYRCEMNPDSENHEPHLRLVQADYSSADPLAGVDQQTYYSPTNHSNSRNPASTGWASSQDPGDWGRSIITNNFGLTTDSALDADPSVAGVLLRARDTGRLLMLQRALSEKDPAGGRWEMPGGHLNDGEKPLHGAVREFEEETGHPFPQDAEVIHTWRSGPYRGHLVDVPSESHLDFSQGRQIENPDGDTHEHVAWWEPNHAKKNPALRPEMKSAPWEQFKKAAGSDKWTDTQYGDGGSANEHRFAEPARMGTHCPSCARPLLAHEMGEGQCENCLTAHEAPDYSGGHAQHVDRDSGAKFTHQLDSEWNPIGYELHQLHTNSTLVNDPDEVGALPYTTGEAEDVFAGQTGGSSGDTSLPHASTDALHGDQGAHTIDSLHQAKNDFLDSPGAAALMADLGITKSAMKDFSFSEQQDLINEGGNVRARNFGDLKIAGTHYEHLKDEDDGDLFL